MNDRQFNGLLAIGFAVFSVLGFMWANQAKTDKDAVHNQVVAAAEDLGCTYIEQSPKNPQNFYIDCGDDEIRIITKDTK